MTNPEQTLPVAAIMVTGYGQHGYATSFPNPFDKPANGRYWANRGYSFDELTPHAPAEAEIARLTEEREAALDYRDKAMELLEQQAGRILAAEDSEERVRDERDAAVKDAARLREALENLKNAMQLDLASDFNSTHPSVFSALRAAVAALAVAP